MSCTRAPLVAAGLAGSLAFAGCSGSDRPPTLHRGATGGDRGSGGSAGQSGTESPLPGELTLPALGSAFDPSQIYFTGQLWQADVPHENNLHTAILAVSDPSAAAASAYLDAIRFIIRPTDGAILYHNYEDDSIRQFQADGGFPDDSSASAANDPAVPLPACPDGSAGRVGSFLIAPDTGDILYLCSWFGNTSISQFASGPTLELPSSMGAAAIGYRGTYLIGSSAIVDANGTVTPINLGAEGAPIAEAVRATQDGFWVLEESTYDSQLIRWHFTLDGEWTKEYYPPSPIADPYYYRHAIDGQGRAVVLVQQEWQDRYPRTQILQFEIGASSGVIVFDSGLPPRIDFDTPRNMFITGP